jgi:curved DNA-binding protein CbpA
VLEVDSKATQQQIRDAYKKAALKHHPDRVPSDSPERTARTKRFQQINDAYYTLSDPTRRRDYDAARTYNSWTGTTATPESEDFDDEVPRPNAGGAGAGAGFGGFPWSAFGFGSAPAGNTEESHNKFSEEQFGGIFEEMLREEGMANQDASPTGKFWSIVGGLSGGAMGFIVANFPGMVAGAVAGNRLGSVRDAKGKSVYEVFRELPQGDKAKLLSEMAAKVFANVVSG